MKTVKTIVFTVLVVLLVSGTLFDLKSEINLNPFNSNNNAYALPPAPAGAKETKSKLKSLKVKSRTSMSGYDREEDFGSWKSQGNSCDTRERVLVRDGKNVKTNSSCKSVSGTWNSFYDGKVIKKSSSVDIDHIVPLGNAWVSGAKNWKKSKRVAFANDLKDSQLIAVSASSNRSKSDSAPDEWMPPRKSAWCLYSRWWVDVKSKYKLTVAKAEVKALNKMLNTC